MKSNDFPTGFTSEANNLAIDFDGVIHDDYLGFHDGTCYGLPLEGALEAIRDLSKSFKIIIFTAKAKPNRPLVDGKTGTELVTDWLRKYNVLKYVSEVTAEKPRAFLYIDDNAYRFTNWKNTLEFVRAIEN
jgi:hypothetical protein